MYRIMAKEQTNYVSIPIPNSGSGFATGNDGGISGPCLQATAISNVEMRYTPLAHLCQDIHRFYALEELISNESTKTSLIALACTQCGSLILHKVHAQ